jgi:hypothetical protein
MCWDGLTVQEAARIGCGIGLFLCGVAVLAVLAFQAFIAWCFEEDDETATERRGHSEGGGGEGGGGADGEEALSGGGS